MPTSVSEWLNAELSKLLDFPVPSDLTSYILSIENARDLEEYLKTLLNFQDPTHRQFLTELLKKCARQNQSNKGNKTSEVEQKYTVSKQYEKRNKFSPQESASKKDQAPSIIKKKPKFVGLYTQEGQNKDVILLKGRHKCFCQASKHGLVNNCMQCGRIICEQEGPGPCLFCGNLVCHPPGEYMDATSVIGAEVQMEYQKPMVPKSADWQDAMDRRDRLLDYDRTCEKRTKVIDDENDYFSTNSAWLSKEEREQLKKRETELKSQRDASRLNKTITFDFAGRKVIEDDDFDNVYDPDDPVLKAISESIHHKGKVIPTDGNSHPKLFFPQPVFQDLGDASSSTARNNCSNLAWSTVHRVQDQGLLEMHDQGLCLSLHQPWASLLVYGIMKDEGRTWYSSHRGRLWIAAASKVPTPQDVKETEDFFRMFENNENIKFPAQYPTSCLLGFVDVVDCLSQEDYRAKFADGRSESPYVFICENAHHLPLYFPIQGKHKIYNLEQRIHHAAQKTLQRISKLQFDKLMDAEWV